MAPYRALRPCPAPGCQLLTPGGRCPEHAREQQREAESRRDRSETYLYDARWGRARRCFLRAHPFCVHCEQRGKLTAATVVDHIKPHRGDAVLFWSESNWQSLCKHHHDVKTAREEGGFGNPRK